MKPMFEKKRVFAFLLALVLLVGFMPGFAHAAAPDTERHEIIAMDAVWKYNDLGQDLGTDWYVNPDVSTWKEGPQPLGFGDAIDEVDGVTPLRTEISFGDNPNDKHMTSYFQKVVEMPDLSNYLGMEFYIHADDGAVVYLNGKEIVRVGLDAGVPVDYNTSFKFKQKEDILVIPLKDLPLQEGQNIFTAEVHQDDGGSSDLWFEFAATAVKVEEYVKPVPAWISENENRILEVNAHAGKHASYFQNISWTQLKDHPVTISVIDHWDGSTIVDKQAVEGKFNDNVYTYFFELGPLYPNSQYTYIIENGQDKVTGTFFTARTYDQQGTVRFGYIADPQISNDYNAEHTGAIFNQLNQLSKEKPFDFMYIAGDHTDTSDDEFQWFNLFHNNGATPESTQEFFLNNTLVSTPGNHDDTKFKGHIFQPDMGGEGVEEGVYDVDYPGMKFIILNNRSSNPDKLFNQIDFLRTKVAEAKARGQWTIVGFHKPLYTGASHIDDKDSIAFRKKLNPILAELNVDMVLAGHDHVYSRGFVDKNGYLATQENEALSTPEFPVYNRIDGAPMHMVAEHGGGLKWYRAIDYPITDGDPIAPNYEFLDINSAQGIHPVPGAKVLGNEVSADKKEQTYVVAEVEKTKATFTTYKMKYDADTDTITTAPYIYDQFSIVRSEEDALAEWARPEKDRILEVNAHAGGDAPTSQNITWTQLLERPAKITVKTASGEKVYQGNVDAVSNGSVYNHQLELTGLKPNTKYFYTIDNSYEKVNGSFTTAKAVGAPGSVRFAFIADPQIRDAFRGESSGAIFDQLNKLSATRAFDFLYIAGDHTDTPDNENQWFHLFHNEGATPEAAQKFFLRNTLVSTQGNHDTPDMMGHINQPDEAGEGVYDVDFGQVKFIILNNASYDTADLANNAAFQKQVSFLKEKVAEGRANNQWIMVGFHKPIYTGASHIDDGDVIEYRKHLNPILTELNVDMVLAGHDHVYSRGFIGNSGTLVSELNEVMTAQKGYPVYNSLVGAPLHMVAEHAGGLKWYKTVEYDIAEGDPIAPNYEFLDVNSAGALHPEMSAEAYADKTSSQLKDQTYVDVVINDEEAIFTTYKMHYDAETDTITKEPHVYDKFSILKKKDQTSEAKGYTPGPMNLRSTPDGEIITSIPAYVLLEGEVNSKSPAWLKVTYEGKEGYVYRPLLADGYYKRYAVGQVNTRVKPNGEIVGSIAKGRGVEGVYYNEAPNWLDIKLAGKKVSVYKPLLQDYPVACQVFAAGQVNLRETPNGTVIGSIPMFAELNGTIDPVYTNWLKVTYEGKTGFVFRGNLVKNLVQEKATIKGITNVRNKPGVTDSKVIGVLTKGAAVEGTICPLNEGWLVINFAGRTGYIWRGTYQ